MAESVQYPLANSLKGRGNVPFDQFVTESRANGLNPALWHREKRSGALETELLPDGSLVIRAVETPKAGQ